VGGAATWRVFRAWFPGSIDTHNLVLDFFFGEDLMLSRHDWREYRRRICSGAAHLGVCHGGWHSPANQTPGLPAWPDRRPIRELLMVSIDISEVGFQ
jgi:hypothetical protein